jgi:Kdo2-lipid IVA lauroyltransferase/acyltransferase
MARRKTGPVKRLSTLISIFFLRLTRLLPLPLARKLMLGVAAVAWYAVPRLRQRGLENLERAYGDTLTREEKHCILRDTLRNAAVVAAEFSRIPAMASKQFEGAVRIEGGEHLDPARGCLCMGGHLGNWEWMAPAMASRGYKAAEVVRPFDDPLMDRVIDGLRRAGGVRTIPKDHAAAAMGRLIAEGWMVGVLIDQNPRENAAPADFFGETCWSTVAPAIIAARTGAPVHPVAMIRDTDGTYILRFYPALEMARSGNTQRDIVENTQRCQHAFEKIVREYPGQWLWLHRRWKRRERLEQEWAERQRAASEQTSGEEG